MSLDTNKFPEKDFCLGEMNCEHFRYIAEKQMHQSALYGGQNEILNQRIEETRIQHCEPCKATKYVRYRQSKSPSS